MERPFTLDHLDHIVLRVRDLQKSLAFYAMLGADGQREVAAGTVMRIASNPNQSPIFQERSDYDPPEPGAIDHINLTIRASSIDDVGSLLAGKRRGDRARTRGGSCRPHCLCQ